MRKSLLTITLAFLSGLSVGGFAVGYYDAPPAGAGRHDSHDSPVQALAGVQHDQERTGGWTGSEVAATPSAVTDGRPAGVEIRLGPMNEAEQIQILLVRWEELQGLVTRLNRRVGDLEQQVSAIKPELSVTRTDDREAVPEVLPAETPDDQRHALVVAGVPETTAEDLVWRQSELELERLELRDRAIREGWHQSERYFEAVRDLNSDAVDLRREIGEPAYDNYLYRTGAPNRIQVTSVIQGSVAEQSGLLPGDVIESYGGERIYSYSDLRETTTKGARDEMVSVLIQRGGARIEASIPRGPMGVRIEASSISPDG